MTATTRAKRRLSGRMRKTVLVLHIIAAAAWFGIDLALGILACIALLTDDRVVAGTSLQAIEWFAVWPMFGASIACLIAGVVLGIGSKYGLVRYWWVAVKLAVNVLMSTLIVFSLRPGIVDAGGIGRRLVAGDATAAVPGDLLYPVLVAPTLLLVAYLLSVFKPWGRTRRSKTTPATQKPREPRAARTPIGV